MDQDKDRDDIKASPSGTKRQAEESTVERPAHQAKEEQQQHKRAICPRCDRPSPTACICAALPDQPLTLNKCRIVVLQHPHERKRTNRSLPLVQLCLDPECIQVSIGRRFGSQPDKNSNTLTQLLSKFKKVDCNNDSSYSSDDDNPAVWLVYPSPDAIPLDQALLEQQQQQQHSKNSMIFLIFLDATWKFAREMDQANQQRKQYPSNMVRVRLPSSSTTTTTQQQSHRFAIRTQPAEQPHCVSTAEAIARVISLVEDDPVLEETILKPVDAMVSIWNSFRHEQQETKKRRYNNNDDDDDDDDNAANNNKNNNDDDDDDSANQRMTEEDAK